MSEPRLISPMLDDFLMGDAISCHHGVRCCPAMRKSNDDKYFVKIISVPASQVQLDALLLTGAYQNEEDALAYFRELAQDIHHESELLQRFSKLEGYDAYEACQTVPMEDGVGYDVYLLSPYKRNLERFCRRKSMTHLAAVNLGLDMCAALSVARKAGYLYVNLKPDNIFVTEDNVYHIGDLGFISLASLKYASLPEKYRSRWTAPEIADAYASLNDTLDVYALGLILYQAYNDGQLPFGDSAPAEELPAPLYADPEMAQIILKACAPNPEDRWQDPLQMGQALANYMQTSSINDTPIVPPPVEEEVEDAPIEPNEEASGGAYLTAEPQTDEESAPETEMDVISEEPEIDVEISAEDNEQAATDISAEQDDAQLPEEINIITPEENAVVTELPEVELPAEEEQQLTIEDILADANFNTIVPGDTDTPEVTPEAANDGEVTDEVIQMLALADELLAHGTPAPVVAPEPIEVPMPAPILREAPAEQTEEETLDAEEATQEEQTESQADDAEDASPVETTAQRSPDELENEELDAYENRVQRRKSILVPVIILLTALLLIGSCMFFYRYYYLQEISGLRYTLYEDTLVISLTTNADESGLTVYCTDTHGNSMHSSVVDGTAAFDGLAPGTDYKITVEIEGFHKLIGQISTNITTAEKTEVLSFTAVTGAEDGSVILQFSADSHAPDEWKIIYSAPGEAEQEITTTGNIVTLTGLTVGAEYTFRLDPVGDVRVGGISQITHVVSPVILAEKLVISEYRFTSLTASWNAPEGVNVEEWTVRCYNQNGYDKTITVFDTTAVFEDIDSTLSYTIEVTAQGMTQSIQIYVSANPIVILDLVATIDEESLEVSWQFQGVEPKGGWLVLYSINGSEMQSVVTSGATYAIIDDPAPRDVYTISIKPANGVDVFNNTCVFTIPELRQ